MTSREDRVHAEVSALWRELHGAPAPADADAGTVLDSLLRGLPEVSYERLKSPFLRPSALTWARPA